MLMRVAAGGALVAHGVASLAGGLPLTTVAFPLFGAAIGALLLVGLWTPIASVLAALDAAIHGFSDPVHAGFYVLLGALAIALALLGPGAWSVDARLFGWKRVEIRNGRPNGDQKRRETPPF